MFALNNLSPYLRHKTLQNSDSDATENPLKRRHIPSSTPRQAFGRHSRKRKWSILANQPRLSPEETRAAHLAVPLVAAVVKCCFGDLVNDLKHHWQGVETSYRPNKTTAVVVGERGGHRRKEGILAKQCRGNAYRMFATPPRSRGVYLLLCGVSFPLKPRAL